MSRPRLALAALVVALASPAVAQQPPAAAAAPSRCGGLLCDADLCLRLGAKGRSVLLDGAALVAADPLPAADPADRLLFAARHAEALRRGDPWYNPLLDPDGSWLLRRDDGCRTVHPARVVTRRPAPEAAPG